MNEAACTTTEGKWFSNFASSFYLLENGLNGPSRDFSDDLHSLVVKAGSDNMIYTGKLEAHFADSRGQQ